MPNVVDREKTADVDGEKTKGTGEVEKKADRFTKIPDSLEDAGVSVINMNGIYFKHFQQLFCNLKGGNFLSIPVRCAGITDRDPRKKVQDKTGKEIDFKPTQSQKGEGLNHALELIPIVRKSEHTRLYSNDLKTFEYDLAMEKENLNEMLAVAKELIQTDGPLKRKVEEYAMTKWIIEKDDDKKAEIAFFFLKLIEKPIDKGEFAQALASRLASDKPSCFSVPEYIRKAVIWACGGPDG